MFHRTVYFLTAFGLCMLVFEWGNVYDDIEEYHRIFMLLPFGCLVLLCLVLVCFVFDGEIHLVDLCLCELMIQITQFAHLHT